MKTKGQTRVLRTGMLAAAACVALASPALAQEAPPAPTGSAPGAPVSTAPASTAPASGVPAPGQPVPGAPAPSAPVSPAVPGQPVTGAPAPPPAFVPAAAPTANKPSSPWDKPAPPEWLYLEPYDYKGGDEIPPGYVLTEKERKWPYVVGGAVFGGAYAICVAVGFAGVLINQQAPQQWGPMFIPVFGPFIAIDTLDAGGVNGSDGQVAMFAGAGIVQLLGAATLVSAMFLPPKKVLIPQTPFGEVETSSRRRGPRIELQLPRVDVARIPGPTGDQLGGSLVFQGQFDL